MFIEDAVEVSVDLVLRFHALLVALHAALQ